VTTFAALLTVWADQHGLRHSQSAGPRDKGKLNHSAMARRLSSGHQQYDAGRVRQWLSGGLPQETPQYFSERMGISEADIAAALTETRYKARRPVNLDEHTEAVIKLAREAMQPDETTVTTAMLDAHLSELRDVVVAGLDANTKALTDLVDALRGGPPPPKSRRG
jgi:hypothetical protein